MTRGLREITRLGVRLGADPLTFLGLAGVGDLILTCTSNLSRNRKVGLALGRGQRLAEIVAGMGGEVAEGVRTTAGACALARLHGVEMPIAECTRQVLDGEITAKEAVESLLRRQLRNENE
jgi:glycerol-3-phosphate dehydrogenase (NAD(P)+)